MVGDLISVCLSMSKSPGHGQEEGVKWSLLQAKTPLSLSRTEEFKK